MSGQKTGEEILSFHHGQKVMEGKYKSYDNTIQKAMEEAKAMRKKSKLSLGDTQVPNILKNPIGQISMEEIDDIH